MDADIGPGATCVIGVQAQVDGSALGRLRGPVKIELSVDGITDELDAVMCQRFCRGDPLIMRRTSRPMARTMAVDAAKTAKDIRRDLVAKLTEPGAELTVTVREQSIARPPVGCVLIVSTQAGDRGDFGPRALAALSDADGLVAEDRRTARRWLKSLNLPSPLLAAADSDIESIAARLLRGDRLAVLATGLADPIGEAGRRAIAGASRVGAAIIPIAGPAAGFAALVAGTPTERYQWRGILPASGRLRRGVFREAADGTTATAVVVEPGDLSAVLAELAAFVGDRQVSVCMDVGEDTETVSAGPAIELGRDGSMPRPRAPSLVVVSARPASAEASTSGEGDSGVVDRMITSLVDQGAPTRMVAKALADASGISRQEAYAKVLAGKRG